MHDMTTRKGIAWNLAWEFEGEDGYDAATAALLAILPETFFWDRVAWVGQRGADLAPLTIDRLVAAVNADYRTWQVASSTDRLPDLDLTCHRVDDSLQLRLLIRDRAWHDLGRTLVGGLERLTSALAGALPERSCFGIGGGVRPAFQPTLEYPRCADEPGRDVFAYGQVIDVLDRRNLEPRNLERWAEVGLRDWAEALGRVAAAPLPPDARRSELGAVVIQTWTDALGDEAALIDACARHDRWLAAVLQPPA